MRLTRQCLSDILLTQFHILVVSEQESWTQQHQ